MDNLPPSELTTFILIAAGSIAFLLTMLLITIETAYSSCILSEETFEKLKELKTSVRTHLIWLLNHPLSVHRSLLFFRTLFIFVVALTIVNGVLLLTQSALTLCLVVLGFLVLLAITSALAQSLGVKHPIALLRGTATFTSALVKTGRALLRMNAPEQLRASEDTFSVESLEQALEMQKTEEEKSILNGVLHFGEETVTEVMIPRVDVVEISVHADFSEVMQCVIENNYSRIPVRDNVQDKIKGILYVKDLLPYCNRGKDFDWQRLIRQPFFVPESKMIDDLLREFQKNKIHIAVVIDEYGVTSGIVTMEDILEEIVGDINDEYDEEEKHYIRLDENIYIFEGKTPLTDFFETLHLEEEDYADEVGEAETLAGFVLELMDEFPTKHQTATCRSLTFEVLALDKRRISKVKVTIAKKEAEDAPSQ